MQRNGLIVCSAARTSAPCTGAPVGVDNEPNHRGGLAVQHDGVGSWGQLDIEGLGHAELRAEDHRSPATGKESVIGPSARAIGSVPDGGPVSLTPRARGPVLDVEGLDMGHRDGLAGLIDYEEPHGALDRLRRRLLRRCKFLQDDVSEVECCPQSDFVQGPYPTPSGPVPFYFLISVEDGALICFNGCTVPFNYVTGDSGRLPDRARDAIGP